MQRIGVRARTASSLLLHSRGTFRFLSSNSSSGSFQHLLVEKRAQDRTALIRLNRPKQLNALCDALIEELNTCTRALDKDGEVGCIVITGSEKAFAAGADIKEMRPRGWVDSYVNNALGQWGELTKIQTPVIAAVNGYALGGKPWYLFTNFLASTTYH